MQKSLVSRINDRRKNFKQFCFYILIKFFRLFSYKDLIILFDNLSSVSEEADAKKLYQYLNNKGYKVFFISNIIIDDKLKKKFLFKYRKELIRCKSIMSSFFLHEQTEFYIKKLDIKYVFLQHGVFLFKLSAIDLCKERNYDYTIISSPLEFELLKNKQWNTQNLIKGGLPRWDNLMRQEIKPVENILVMFTWRKALNRKKEQLKDSKYYINLISLLKKLSTTDKYIYLALHHAFSSTVQQELRNLDCNIKIIDNRYISQYVQSCDLLITDFSSISFDFFYQHKPVVFYLLDKNDPFLEQEEIDDMKHFDLLIQKTLPVCISDNEDKLLKLIEENSINTFDEKIIFYYRDNICHQLEIEFKRLNLI